MKVFSILLFCAAVVALLPAQAQGRRSRSAAPAAAAGAEEAAPKTGVRFVICSPAGVSMPSPLYVRSGKEFKTISIGSRTPSARVKPVGGVVEFWDQNPAPAMAEGDKKAPKAAAEKLPEPIFTVTVPASAGSKSVCILSPNKDVKKTSTLFLNENDFPKKGMHVINLSSFPLQIITSESNDFKDKKESKIGVYRREEGICHKIYFIFLCRLDGPGHADPIETDRFQIGSEWIPLREIGSRNLFPRAIRDNIRNLTGYGETIFIGSEKEG